LPQHPAQRLADEELPLLQEQVRVTDEALPVSLSPAQGEQEGEDGATADPEVGILHPAVETARQLRIGLDERPHELDREGVHVGPGARAAEEVFEEVEIFAAEIAAAGG